MRKVLIVDDLQINRDIYRMILEYCGYTVLEAENGADGVSVACAETPDAIIMDVSMPVLDGLEATRRLKADADTSAIPVLILTARAHPLDRAAALDAGADAYLAKPSTPRTVLAEVERLISASQSPTHGPPV